MIMFLISKWYKVSLQDLEVANKALEDEVTKNRAGATAPLPQGCTLEGYLQSGDHAGKG